MTGIRNKTLAFLALLFLVSCAKLPVYQGSKVDVGNKSGFPEEIAQWYDQKSKMKYGVVHDEENLYISLIFLEQTGIWKLMNGDFHIFLDPEGKKGRMFSLQFPLKKEKLDSENKENDSNRRSRTPSVGNGSVYGKRFLQNIPNEAVWTHNGEEQVFYWRIQNCPCHVNLAMNPLGQLEYRATIPLKLLFAEEMDRNLISIGIQCKAGSSSSSGMKKGGEMSGRMGRKPGGKGGMGRGRGNPSESGKGMGTGSMTEPIDIWFQVKLANTETGL